MNFRCLLHTAVCWTLIVLAASLSVHAEAAESIVGEHSTVGSDLVVVLDTTSGMDRHFPAVADALETAFRSVERKGLAFRAALLAFRNRPLNPECNSGYLTSWKVDLTADLQRLPDAVRTLDAVSCGTEETQGSVYDALVRAISDPAWREGSFKTILLIGDSPPHGAHDREKNPLGLSTSDITQRAAQRNIRLLTLKIGLDGSDEFEALARGDGGVVTGRFRAAGSSTSVASSMLEMLGEEILLLTKVNAVRQQHRTRRGVRIPAAPNEIPGVPREGRIALLIGIDEYENDIRKLSYAAADARKLGALLHDAFGFDVQVLLNGEATRDRILQSISQLRDSTAKNDQLFFFFAGHGLSFRDAHGENIYILPQDAEGTGQGDAWRSGISMRDLRDHLLKLPPRHILMAFDACFAGQAAEPSSMSLGPRDPVQSPYGALPGILARAHARQIVTAGVPGQEVLEKEEWGNSAFTKALIQGLAEGKADRNRDGIVPTTELFSYVQEAVTRLTGGRQTPDYRKLTGDYGEFFFVVGSVKRDEKPGEEHVAAKATGRVTFKEPIKVMVRVPRTRIYASPEGQEGLAVLFFQDVVYIKGETRNGRAAVALDADFSAPTGWVDSEAFEPWRTDEILLLDSRDTRAVVEVHEDPRCARLSQILSEVPGCRTRVYDTVRLGKSPQSLFLPVLDEKAGFAKIGFLSLPRETHSVDAEGEAEPTFVSGWLTPKGGGLARTEEHRLSTRREAQRLSNALETIGWLARRNAPGGGETFLLELRRNLPRLFGMEEREVLAGADGLHDLLDRGGALPVKSDLLDLSFSELAEWTPEDLEKFSEILEERAGDLRTYLSESRPGTTVGESFHIFLPSGLVP